MVVLKNTASWRCKLRRRLSFQIVARILPEAGSPAPSVAAGDQCELPEGGILESQFLDLFWASMETKAGKEETGHASQYRRTLRQSQLFGDKCNFGEPQGVNSGISHRFARVGSERERANRRGIQQ
jgi:hypothetical protein